MLEALWNWVVRRIEREGEVIRRAPLAFGLAVGLGVILTSTGIWFVMGWRYEGTISGLGATIRAQEATIKLAEERRAQQEDLVTQLREPLQSKSLRTEDAEQLRSKLVEAEMKLAELQRSLTPGCLTGEDEVNLIQALSVSPPHSFYIYYARGDRHAVTCAESFRRVLQGAQWVERNYLPEDFESSQKGLLVRVKDAAIPPPGAEVFTRVLEQRDIEVVVRTAPVWSTNEYDVFALYVGYKP